jgi:hypothetical protein
MLTQDSIRRAMAALEMQYADNIRLNNQIIRKYDASRGQVLTLRRIENDNAVIEKALNELQTELEKVVGISNIRVIG